MNSFHLRETSNSESSITSFPSLRMRRYYRPGNEIVIGRQVLAVELRFPQSTPQFNITFDGYISILLASSPDTSKGFSIHDNKIAFMCQNLQLF